MSLLLLMALILGVIMAVLVGLVLFSLLAMARKGEETLDRLELERLRSQAWSAPSSQSPDPGELSARTAVVRYHDDAPQPGPTPEVEPVETLVGLGVRFSLKH